MTWPYGRSAIGVTHVELGIRSTTMVTSMANLTDRDGRVLESDIRPRRVIGVTVTAVEAGGGVSGVPSVLSSHEARNAVAARTTTDRLTIR